MRCAEGGDVCAEEREADGVGVAAEAGEEALGVDGGEGVEEVEAFNGAAGAVGVAVLFREDDGGAAGAVDDAGGEDAEDAAMPLGMAEDDALGWVGTGFGAKGEQLELDGFEGGGFAGAAVLVEGVELLREFCGRGRGSRVRKSSTTSRGDVHAAGGVDTRGEAEADLVCGGGAVQGDFGDLHEGAEARLNGVGELAQADGDDGAILAGEGDGVGDGGDGDELEEGRDEAV